MNKIKAAVSAILAAVMLFSLAACHPANESAMTVGEMEVPAGIYLCAMIQADGEARSAVDDAKKAEAEENGETDSTASKVEDYYKEKVGDTDFTEWVKNRTKEICTEYAVYTQLFNEKGLELPEAEVKQIDAMTDTYWNSYGYSEIYAPNGVSFASYKEFFTYTYKTKACFMDLYGEGGEKAIPQADIDAAIDENFAAAGILSIPYYTSDDSGNKTDKSDEEITAIKTRVQNYAERMENGEKFTDLFFEEYPDKLPEKEEELPSEDEMITIFVSEKAQPYMSSQYFSYEYFEEVKALESGKTYTVDSAENKFSAVMCKAKPAGEYEDYKQTLTDAAMYILKQEEFENDIKAYIETLNVEVNNYAVKRFKPSDIEYPNYNNGVTA